MSWAVHCQLKIDCRKQIYLNSLLTLFFKFPTRSEDDYSEEEDEEDEDDDEEEYDGEIPQPELEPRSRRCLVGDGVCVIPGDSEEEEDNEEEDDEGRGGMCGEDSDSDGSVLYKEDSSDEDEEDEPPLSRMMRSNFL